MTSPLSSDRWRQIEPLLDAALELEPACRAAYLDAACGGDAALRAEVEGLLEALADDGADGRHFVDGGLPEGLLQGALGERLGDGVDLPLPRPLGPYRLVERLGHGGMGEVYRAERADGEFESAVALKVIRPDLLSPEVERRFRQERQILAGLEHPNIARLLDGGISEEGAPYLVMELVAGLTILDFCDRHRLSIDARLALFCQVCAAVEAAHRRLIVHRDLKPENVLVNDAGQPKLLDFGIAKILDRDEGDQSTVTRLMTPGYAAPEQLAGGLVTTASDVYALGLILYELLAGSPPFPREGLTAVELQRLRLASRPARASSTLGASPSAAEERAHLRACSRRQLLRQLQGDLDCILDRALEPEPDPRYPSVEALRHDLERHRAGLPVTASPGGMVYRVLKWGRRHRVGVAASFLVASSLVVAATVSTLQARRARQAEEVASAVNRFLLDDLLAAAAPEVTQGEDLTVAAALDNAALRVGSAFADKPWLEAALRRTIGGTYLRLGDLEAAQQQLERSHRLLLETRGPDAPETLETELDQARLLVAQGRVDEAHERLIDLLRRETGVLSETHLSILVARGELGRVQHLQGDWISAERTLRAALADLERRQPSAWRERLQVTSRLAALLRDQRKGTESLELVEQTLDLQRRHLGATHPDLIDTLTQRSDILGMLERPEEANASAQQALELARTVLGAAHPRTVRAMNSAANALYRIGRIADGQALAEQALELSRRVLGEEHPTTITLTGNLGVFARFTGRYDESETLYRRAIDLNTRVKGESHPSTIRALKNLTGLLETRGRPVAERTAIVERVLAAYRGMTDASDADPTVLSDYAEYLLTCRPERLRDPAAAMTVARRAVEASRHHRAEPLMTLGQALRANGQLDAAIQAYQEAAALPEALHLYAVDRDLVAMYLANDDLGGAEAFLLAHLERRRAARGADDPLIGYSLAGLTRLYLETGRYQEAQSRALETIAQYEKHASGRRDALRAHALLGAALGGLGDYERGEKELLAVVQAMKGGASWLPEHQREVFTELADLYQSWGKDAEAAVWRERKPS